MSQERIKIVGAGLIGTSLGLALTKHGIDVGLENRSKANLRLAIEYGAGKEAQGRLRPGNSLRFARDDS